MRLNRYQDSRQHRVTLLKNAIERTKQRWAMTRQARDADPDWQQGKWCKAAHRLLHLTRFRWWLMTKLKEVKAEREASANTRVRVSHGTTGPHYDPYGYTVLTVYRYGVEYELLSCGLRGESLHVDGEWVSGEPDHTACQVHETFEQLTGARFDQWMMWYERNYVEDPMGPLSRYV